jgi:hypothetical protein
MEARIKEEFHWGHAYSNPIYMLFFRVRIDGQLMYACMTDSYEKARAGFMDYMAKRSGV